MAAILGALEPYCYVILSVILSVIGPKKGQGISKGKHLAPKPSEKRAAVAFSSSDAEEEEVSQVILELALIERSQSLSPGEFVTPRPRLSRLSSLLRRVSTLRYSLISLFYQLNLRVRLNQQLWPMEASCFKVCSF